MDGGQPICWNRKRDDADDSQEAGSYFDAVLKGESCGTNWYALEQAYCGSTSLIWQASLTWQVRVAALTHVATLPNMAGTRAAQVRLANAGTSVRGMDRALRVHCLDSTKPSMHTVRAALA